MLVTFHNGFIFFCFAKLFQAQIHIHTLHIHTHIHIYICIYICIYMHIHIHTCMYIYTCMYMCVCVCVWEGEEEREGRKGWVGGWVGWCVCVCCVCVLCVLCGVFVLVFVSLCWWLCVLCVLIPSAVSLKIAETEQPYLVKRMIGGLENVLFSSCYQTLQGKEPRVLSANLSEARDNSTWAVSWLAELTVTPLPSPSFLLLSPVCPSKKPLCVDSKRPRVHRHHARMWWHICAWCRYTRRRFECAHGGVSESTYGFFHYIHIRFVFWIN